MAYSAPSKSKFVSKRNNSWTLLGIFFLFSVISDAVLFKISWVNFVEVKTNYFQESWQTSCLSNSLNFVQSTQETRPPWALLGSMGLVLQSLLEMDGSSPGGLAGSHEFAYLCSQSIFASRRLPILLFYIFICVLEEDVEKLPFEFAGWGTQRRAATLEEENIFQHYTDRQGLEKQAESKGMLSRRRVLCLGMKCTPVGWKMPRHSQGGTSTTPRKERKLQQEKTLYCLFHYGDIPTLSTDILHKELKAWETFCHLQDEMGKRGKRFLILLSVLAQFQV